MGGGLERITAGNVLEGNGEPDPAKRDEAGSLVKKERETGVVK